MRALWQERPGRSAHPQPLPDPHESVSIGTGTLGELPKHLRAGQKLFDATGGLHAAGLFTADGTLLALREDIGRHTPSTR